MSIAHTLNQYLPPELTVFFTAMIPIIELRGAIPFGIHALKLPILDSFFWATLGNIAPNFLILLLLGPITDFFRKHFLFFDRFIEKIFSKTRAQHSEKFNKYGAIFLVIFIAIPIPGSGSWTASLIAYLFNVPYFKAMGLIALGVAGAGLIITFSIEGIIALFRAIL